MKKIILLFSAAFIALVINAQTVSPQVIASAGDYYEGANVSLSWTLGEIATETLSNGNIILTQGFQQPITVFLHGVDLDLMVYLEGPYIPATGGTMSAELNTVGYIPLAQPYNPTLPYYDIVDPGELKWLYGGSETVGAMPADVVDWVLVQLREADVPGNATSATILDTQAAFLKNDGTVVGLDGVSPLYFDVAFSENLFAVVYHRNHLAIISNYPLTESGGMYTYDFSSSVDQAYGGANGHKMLETDVWGMVAGDGNGNGLIQNTDETAVWKVDLGNSGYMGGDFNLNGLTQNTDETNYWKINLGSGGQTPGKQENTGYKSQVPD